MITAACTRSDAKCYHWSLDQVEFATDIVFYRAQDLQAIYRHLTRTAIHAVKADNVATFLGRRLRSNTPHEIGKCLRHHEFSAAFAQNLMT